MMKNLQWRIGLIVAVIGLSVWAFVPPDQKVKLGLDLKGGVHPVSYTHLTLPTIYSV